MKNAMEGNEEGSDTRLKSPLLYQLSYALEGGFEGGNRVSSPPSESGDTFGRHPESVGEGQYTASDDSVTPHPWRISHRADPNCLPLANRHYNRQSPDSPQFVPPGRCVVLKAGDPVGAFWITSWPFAEYVRHAWAGAWVCSAFRREDRRLGLASDLIRSDVAATIHEWPAIPRIGMVTFIDPSRVAPVKVRGLNVWGYSYRKAGFVPAVCPVHNWSAESYGPPRDCAACRSETAGGLLAFQLFPASMPLARAPHTDQLSLFTLHSSPPSAPASTGGAK